MLRIFFVKVFFILERQQWNFDCYSLNNSCHWTNAITHEFYGKSSLQFEMLPHRKRRYWDVKFFEWWAFVIVVNVFPRFYFQTLFFLQVCNVAVSKFSFRSTNTFKLSSHCVVCDFQWTQTQMKMKMQTCNYIRWFGFFLRDCLFASKCEHMDDSKLCFDACHQTMPMRRKFLNVMQIFFSANVCSLARVLTNDCVIVHQLLLLLFCYFVCVWAMCLLLFWHLWANVLPLICFIFDLWTYIVFLHLFACFCTRR